jgi:hypothetical protein
MGILAREGYEDQLTVAYLSMMSHINDLVERHQSDARPTLVVTDEGHIITTNPLLARYVVKITKMWRKLGAWLMCAVPAHTLRARCARPVSLPAKRSGSLPRTLRTSRTRRARC